MYKYGNIIFDLDGTLTDPREGILNSLKYALKKMSYSEIPDELPEKFIGPPLQQSFSEIYRMNKRQTELAVMNFREYYGLQGLYENNPFTGITELLESLNMSGFYLFIATSKLEKFAWQIIRHFEFDRYIKDLVGADYDGNHSKCQLIEQIISKYRLKHSGTVMIGDTDFDFIGAHEAGVDCIGVTYGFGKEEDLKRFNPPFLAGSPMELLEYLTQ